MRVCGIVSLDEVAAPRGYNTVGAGLLLTVGRSTLTSHVAMGTLASGATVTLGVASSEGTGGDTIARRWRIAARSLMALCTIAGIVLPSGRRLSHAVKTVMSSGEMVGVAQWLG